MFNYKSYISFLILQLMAAIKLKSPEFFPIKFKTLN